MLRLIPPRGKAPRAQLLDEVKREVQALRSQSLQRAVLLNFQGEKPPQQLQRSWDIEIKIGNRPSVQLPQKTSITQVFDRTGGQLVILGVEGAGKTTMLLELAGKLVSRSQEDISLPVPVLLNLSSWKDDTQAIADWLTTQLDLKYRIPTDQSKQWISQQQLLPLLDGLDELEAERQERCIQAINQLIEGENSPKYLVVCSSFEAYKNCETRLRLRAAILLKPLTESQIQNYLLAARSRELWYGIQNEPDLLKLAKTPLLLTMMTLGYEEILLHSWKRLNSMEERRNYLFNAFIRRQMTREINQHYYAKGKEPRQEQMRHWLGWLAKRMQQESLIEFSVGKLSRSCLETSHQQQMYQTGIQVITGLIFGLSVGLIVGLIQGWFWGGISGVVAGAISSMVVRVPIFEYLTVRWVLWRQGCIPWNYRRFLNGASERLLLQRVGDRYRFIHKCLQDRFADFNF